MKKLLPVLLCLLLALIPALAEEIEATPEPEPFGDFSPRDGGMEQETFTLQVGDETVRLIYDESPMYSSIQSGLVQASYYAYGADGDTMYLMYIIFPDTAGAGMVLTPEYAAMTGEECSVVFIISTSERELYYFSSVAAGLVYPTGSDFSIAIDSVEGSALGTAYAGKLSAELVCMELPSDDSAATLSIPETPFSFTIAGGQAPRVEPAGTSVPGDMRKV